MLFSNDQVSSFIQNNFEPAWESVCPVPVVRVDFGNGTVVTRTLHGNIATYVCSAEGNVLDVLAGMYDPDTYLGRLKELQTNSANKPPARPRPPTPIASNTGSTATARGQFGGQFGGQFNNGGKFGGFGGQNPGFNAGFNGNRFMGIETPLKFMLSGEMQQSVRNQPVEVKASERKGEKQPRGIDFQPGGALWKELQKEAQFSETVRRRQVREILNRAGTVKPQALTKQIFKQVLHLDLDDPHLGMSELLFDSYPFSEEDGEARPQARR